MTRQVRGEFEVTMTPQSGPDAPVGRFALAKAFHGALKAASIGEMLALSGSVAGSAGYVAMERVTGSLEGREGSFALQHSGTMDRGAPTLLITVVPDSGTGALEGLAGRMAIDIIEGRHFYIFDFSLPGS